MRPPGACESGGGGVEDASRGDARPPEPPATAAIHRRGEDVAFYDVDVDAEVDCFDGVDDEFDDDDDVDVELPASEDVPEVEAPEVEAPESAVLVPDERESLR